MTQEFQRPFRTAKAAINAIKAGRVASSALSREEERLIMEWARHVTDANIDNMEALHKLGCDRSALRRQRRLIGSLASRMVAANKAVRVSKARRDQRFALVWCTANCIGYRHRPEAVRVIRERKSHDAWRLICKFSVRDKAQQKLLALALKPFLRLPPSQFLYGGGRPKAVGALVAAMDQAPPRSSAVQLDVVGFYDHVDHAWLERTLPLPRSIISVSVHTGNLRYVPVGAGRARPTGEDLEGLARRGIPQGSALSPLVAEFVMATLIRASGCLDGNALAAIYSDNVVAVLPTAGVSRLVEKLKVEFRSHSAGPFALTERESRLDRRFEFLGYRFSRWRGRATRLTLKPGFLENRFLMFRTRLAWAQSDSDITKAAASMLSTCSQFKACDQARRYIPKVKSEVAWERTYRATRHVATANAAATAARSA